MLGWDLRVEQRCSYHLHLEGWLGRYSIGLDTALEYTDLHRMDGGHFLGKLGNRGLLSMILGLGNG
jgi:hypothetical protein